MLNFMLKPCCRNLFKIADLFCHLASSFNKMARLHTRQSWLKTGLLPTAVNSLVKMNGLRTCLTSTLWTTMSRELCLNATSHFNPAGEHELKKILQLIWNQLPQDSINKAILSFPKRLRACVKAGGGHWMLVLQVHCSLYTYANVCSLFTLQFSSLLHFGRSIAFCPAFSTPYTLVPRFPVPRFPPLHF